MQTFANWEDVPIFDSETSEAAFWSENRPGVRLMPDTPRFGVQARFFNLGMTSGGVGIYSVYRTNGRQVRVLLARALTPEERFFYQKKMNQTLS